MGGSCVAIIAKCVKVTTRSELVIDSVRYGDSDLLLPLSPNPDYSHTFAGGIAFAGVHSPFLARLGSSY